MEEITVGHYKTDNRSRYVYLGAARAKTIEMQPTELGHRLLDIIFEVPLEGQEEPCEFLIRLETYVDEITRFSSMLEEAMENPKPHPWLFDLFHKAVIGMTPHQHIQHMQEEYWRRFENALCNYDPVLNKELAQKIKEADEDLGFPDSPSDILAYLGNIELLAMKEKEKAIVEMWLRRVISNKGREYVWKHRIELKLGLRHIIHDLGLDLSQSENKSENV